MHNYTVFHRGKGPLKNTSDVINAAKKIAEAGSRMDKLARAVADQVTLNLRRNLCQGVASCGRRLSLLAQRSPVLSRCLSPDLPTEREPFLLYQPAWVRVQEIITGSLESSEKAELLPSPTLDPGDSLAALGWCICCHESRGDLDALLPAPRNPAALLLWQGAVVPPDSPTAFLLLWVTAQPPAPCSRVCILSPLAKPKSQLERWTCCFQPLSFRLDYLGGKRKPHIKGQEPNFKYRF